MFRFQWLSQSWLGNGKNPCFLKELKIRNEHNPVSWLKKTGRYLIMCQRHCLQIWWIARPILCHMRQVPRSWRNYKKRAGKENKGMTGGIKAGKSSCKKRESRHAKSAKRRSERPPPLSNRFFRLRGTRINIRGTNFSFCYQTRFEGHSLGTGLIVGVVFSFKGFAFPWLSSFSECFA